MKRSLCLLPLLALAGCAADRPLQRPNFTEAGALAGGGSFGNATMQNTRAMTGERAYVEDLSARFIAEVPSTVTFGFNSDVLTAGAQGALRRQAAWIRQFPEVRFKVYGHTDAVGASAYNRALGLRRARAAVAYLTRHGISRARLEAVVSFGETQPLIVTQGRERRNRRTVTEVSGFIQSHPIIMDGKYAEVVYRETIASAAPSTTLVMAPSAGSLASE